MTKDTEINSVDIWNDEKKNGLKHLNTKSMIIRTYLSRRGRNAIHSPSPHTLKHFTHIKLKTFENRRFGHIAGNAGAGGGENTTC